MDISELISTYEFFSNEKGLYKTWGGIKFPWEISPSTPGLDASNTDDRWSAGIYKSLISYPTGSKILRIEDDGYILAIYEANANITASSFDPSQWDKVCEVKTSIPVGVQTPETLRNIYELYSLEKFDTSWSKAEDLWELPIRDLAFDACNNLEGSLEDLEKCLSEAGSDRWKEYKRRREFFYRKGDIVLVEGECGDSLCLWEAKDDVPATEDIFNEYKHFKPGGYWSKIYCVSTNINKCLEFSRTKHPQQAYDVLEIGSRGHYVESPDPYWVVKDIAEPLLNSMAEKKVPPVIPTKEQIDQLHQP